MTTARRCQANRRHPVGSQECCGEGDRVGAEASTDGGPAARAVGAVWRVAAANLGRSDAGRRPLGSRGAGAGRGVVRSPGRVISHPMTTVDYGGVPGAPGGHSRFDRLRSARPSWPPRRLVRARQGCAAGWKHVARRSAVCRPPPTPAASPGQAMDTSCTAVTLRGADDHNSLALAAGSATSGSTMGPSRRLAIAEACPSCRGLPAMPVRRGGCRRLPLAGGGPRRPVRGRGVVDRVAPLAVEPAGPRGGPGVGGVTPGAAQRGQDGRRAAPQLVQERPDLGGVGPCHVRRRRRSTTAAA